MAEHESSLAVLVDFENMARPGAKGRGDFDIHLVLNRLADKGRVLVKRAYADWSRYRDARHDLQNAGLELIEMPSAREGAKNRADIKMAVDAMELAYSREHLDTFVIVSGDSDFTPLVGKLRELNKRVTGMGNRESASELLIANCDEFIFYDSLAAAARAGSAGRTLDPNELLRQTLLALQREGVEWPLASVVKDSMRRKNPAFDENETGFSTFSKFLEDAQERSIIHLQTDPRSGTYRVELSNGSAAPPALPAPRPPAAEARAAEPRAATAAPADEDRDAGARRRRRRRRGEPAEPKADVFEFVVEAEAETAMPDLPLDQPISYEDVILAGPDLDAGDVADALLEATDIGEAPIEEEPSTGTSRRRRRRRRGEGADLGSADETPGEGAVAPVSEVPAPEADAPDADEPATAETPTEGEGRSRRRRRRTSATTTEASTTADAPVEESPVAPAVDSAAATDAVVEEAPQPEAVTAEAVTEAAVPETVADEGAASRRRVRRGSRRPAGEGEPADTTPAPAADGEAPAPKRRRRTKAEIEADKAAAAQAQTADTTPAPAADGEAPAPKRRRRTKAEIEADKAAAAQGDAAS